MKKIFLSLLFVLIFCSFANDSVIAKTKIKYSIKGDYYSVGVDCFKKGLYDKAGLSFERAIRINPRNVNARYYLAQTYLLQNRVGDAKNQYDRIILLYPTSDAARLSEKGLHLIRQAEMGVASNPAVNDSLAMYKDNYLNYILTGDDKILKWASFPLTVYVEPKQQKPNAMKAFQQWQTGSNNLVSFKFVAAPVNAQISVDFKDKLETSSGDESYIAGYSKQYYKENNIVKSEMHILAIDPTTKQPLGDDFVTFAVLHEIGHTLGFRGHSPNEDDVMAATSKTPKLNLSKRDINTLNVFYKINQKTLLARGKGQTDLQLQQALDYVKQIPDKSVGWANLGDIYRGKKMYYDAIKNYKKAISLEPSKAELYNLIGSTYVDVGDKQNAFSNLKKACDLDKSNTFFLFQFAKFCLNNGQKNIGKDYINAYLTANPSAKSDENIQSLLKLYK